MRGGVGGRERGCGTSHSEEDIGTWKEEMASTLKGNKTDK